MTDANGGLFTLHFILNEKESSEITGNDINAMLTEVKEEYPNAIIPDWGLWVDTEAGQYRLANEYVRRWRDSL